jgi:hypothetical protein
MFKKIAVLIVLSSSLSFACDKGCEEHEGVCACEAPTEQATQADSAVPSDEKPPRNPIPAYERGDVKADMPRPVADKAPDDTQGKNVQ